MAIKTYTLEKKNPKHKQIWEWEETPELVAAIEQLHKSSEALEKIKVPNLYVPNTNYASSKGKKE